MAIDIIPYILFYCGLCCLVHCQWDGWPQRIGHCYTLQAPDGISPRCLDWPSESSFEKKNTRKNSPESEHIHDVSHPFSWSTNLFLCFFLSFVCPRQESNLISICTLFLQSWLKTIDWMPQLFSSSARFMTMREADFRPFPFTEPLGNIFIRHH